MEIQSYATYDKFYYTQCKHIRNFLLCSEVNPLHPQNYRPPSELQLLQDPTEVPHSYEIMHVHSGKI